MMVAMATLVTPALAGPGTARIAGGVDFGELPRVDWCKTREDSELSIQLSANAVQLGKESYTTPQAFLTALKKARDEAAFNPSDGKKVESWPGVPFPDGGSETRFARIVMPNPGDGPFGAWVIEVRAPAGLAVKNALPWLRVLQEVGLDKIRILATRLAEVPAAASACVIPLQLNSEGQLAAKFRTWGDVAIASAVSRRGVRGETLLLKL